jgi:hypothetical protein
LIGVYDHAGKVIETQGYAIMCRDEIDQPLVFARAT